MQAFYLARTGRPGPVLVDVPKDIQQQLVTPDWDTPMAISGYMSRLPAPPEPAQIAAVVKALKGARQPVSSCHGTSTCVVLCYLAVVISFCCYWQLVGACVYIYNGVVERHRLNWRFGPVLFCTCGVRKILSRCHAVASACPEAPYCFVV